jgi:hypothetical protein
MNAHLVSLVPLEKRGRRRRKRFVFFLLDSCYYYIHMKIQ